MKFFRNASHALELIWRRIERTTTNPLIAFNCFFIDRKKHWSKNRTNSLSMLMSPKTDEPGNPEKLPNLTPLLKSGGRAYSPMRYQVSSLGCTLVRSKFTFGDQNVGSSSAAKCKRKVPADPARALHGFNSTQKKFEYGNYL